MWTNPLERYFRQIERITNPPAVKALSESTRRLEAIPSSSEQLRRSLARPEFPGSSNSIHGAFRDSMQGRAANAEVIGCNRALFEALSASSAKSRLVEAGRVFEGVSFLRNAECVARSLEVLQLGSGLDTWQRHVTMSVAPSVALLTTVGLPTHATLAPLPDGLHGAALHWLGDDGELSTAALVRLDGPSRRRRVDADILIDVSCALCSEKLPIAGENLRWNGNRARYELKVLPLCPSCIASSEGDPQEYLERVARFADAPAAQLELVSTGGVSDGIPRGRLKLVPSGEDEP